MTKSIIELSKEREEKCLGKVCYTWDHEKSEWVYKLITKDWIDKVKEYRGDYNIMSSIFPPKPVGVKSTWLYNKKEYKLTLLEKTSPEDEIVKDFLNKGYEIITRKEARKIKEKMRKQALKQELKDKINTKLAKTDEKISKKKALLKDTKTKPEEQTLKKVINKLSKIQETLIHKLEAIGKKFNHFNPFDGLNRKARRLQLQSKSSSKVNPIRESTNETIYKVYKASIKGHDIRKFVEVIAKSAKDAYSRVKKSYPNDTVEILSEIKNKNGNITEKIEKKKKKKNDILPKQKEESLQTV